MLPWGRRFALEDVTQFLRVAADQECPLSQFAPVVDRLHPAAGRLMFRFRPGMRLALDFQNQGAPVVQLDQKIRFIDVGQALQFVRDIEFEPFVAGLAVHHGGSFKLKHGRLLPGVVIAGHGIEVAFPGRLHRLDRLEVDRGGRSHRFVAIEPRQQRGLA